jgi:hypothetical protein
MKRAMTIVGILSLTFAVSCRKAATNEEAAGDPDARDKKLKTESLKECETSLTEAKKASSDDAAAALAIWDKAAKNLQKHKPHIDPASWLKMQAEVDNARAKMADASKLASLKKSYLRLAWRLYAPIEGKPIEVDGKIDEDRLWPTQIWIDALLKNDRGAEALKLALECKRVFDKSREAKGKKIEEKYDGVIGSKDVVPLLKSRIPVDLRIEWNAAKCLAATGKHREAMLIYVRLISGTDPQTSEETKRRFWRLQLEFCQTYIKALSKDKERMGKLVSHIETELPKLGGNSFGGFKAEFFSIAEQARRLGK